MRWLITNKSQSFWLRNIIIITCSTNFMSWPLCTFFHHQPHKHWILIENSVKMKLITSTQAAESGAAQKAESQWQKSYFLPSPRSSCLCMRDTSKPAFDDKHRNVMCACLSFRIIHKDTFNNIFLDPRLRRMASV